MKKLFLFEGKHFERLQFLQNRTRQLIKSGDLEIEDLCSNNLSKYNPLCERFQAIEQFCFQPIIRYSKPERYFNELIAKVYKEIRCDQVCPFITTISNYNDYFWAFPYYNVIAVPPSEAQNLLNLPDLYHEIAHFIFAQYKTIIFSYFSSDLDTYFSDTINDAIDEQTDADNFVPFIKDKYLKWVENWTEEFSCDLIATYLTGSAYAWTNLKMTTLSSGRSEVYSWSNTHPPDASRMQAVFMMLQKMDITEGITEIEDTWQQFLSVVSNPKHKYYKDAFPKSLLRKLTQIIFDTVKSIDLQSFSDQVSKFGNPISKIINDAWQEALKNQDDFAKSEADLIFTIRQKIGIIES